MATKFHDAETELPKLHRLRAWTGPTIVKQVAARIEALGEDVVCNVIAGTEHVVCDVLCAWPEDPARKLIDALNAKDGGFCSLEFKPY